MTIRELREIIRQIPAEYLDKEVEIFFPETVYVGSREDSYAYVTKAEFIPRSSIHNGALLLTKGREFDV